MTRYFNVRRLAQGLIAVSAVCLMGCATPSNNPTSAATADAAQKQQQSQGSTYNENEVVAAISTHLGVTSESAATALERHRSGGSG